MNNVLRRFASRATTAVVVTVILVGGSTLASGLLAAFDATPASAVTVPPWEPDPGSVGGLVFYNAAGTQITGGNVTDAPIAAYVEGTSTVRSGDTVATLYGYLPISGEPTSEWSGLQLGGSTSFPNAGAPAPLNTATLPVETGASGDDTILDLETVYPNLGTGSYADTYQLRLYTNAAGKSQTTTYDSADISISGTGDTATWSVVYPTTPTFSSLGVLPASPEQFGTSETLTATVSPSAAAGTVQFEVGTTDIGTPVTVTSGSAQTTTSALPVGADTLDAVFTPTTSSGYSVSNALAPFTVSTASEGTTTSLNAVTTPITYGSETAETFTGTVTGQSGDGYPKGSVTVYYGASPTVLCNEALPAGSGDSANFSCALTASQLTPNSYGSVDAVFTPAGTSSSNPDFTYTTSTSTPTQSITVDPLSVGTTTSLNAVTTPITYGAETSETFTGTVTGATGDGYPEGTVTVSYGSTPVSLCSETLPAGSGDSASFSCSLTASQLPTGPYTSVDAVFTPAGTSSSNADFTYTTSTSTPTQGFTVSLGSVGTTTSLNAVTTPITYGSETAETFTGTVTGQAGDGYPEGSVTLDYGSTPVALCNETLPAGSGDSAGFSCSLTASQLAAGAYGSVDAVYAPGVSSSSNPDISYTGSTSTPTQSFTVDPVSEGTTTSLNAVTSPILFGSETAETFTGTVTGQSGDGYPEGTVTVYYGASPVELCSETLPAGSGDSADFSCSLSASQLAANTYSSVDAVFTPAGTSSSNPDFSYTASTSSPTQSFTVNPLIPTTTGLGVSPPGPQSAGTSETLTATVSPSQATGSVQFEANGSDIGSTVTVSGGTATYVTSDLPAGIDSLTAVYTPSAGTAYVGSSGSASFTVVPTPPPAPSGSTNSQGATSSSSSGTATASSTQETVTASGEGALTVATYASNPSGVAISDGTGAYYDAQVASGSNFTSLTVTICNPGSGNSLSWLNGSTWEPFSNVTTVGGCLVGTVNSTTSPTLAQLTGTVVAVVQKSAGYTLVASDGGVFDYGGAGFFGSAGSIHLNKPIVGIATTPDGGGYWLVASDGGVFNYGDAGFYGSAGSLHLNKPIVGIAATPDGKGYWLVASDGGIFNYGDAGFFGSAGSLQLNKPIVGVTATLDGGGYWLVASDGGIFNYGDAGFFGSAGSLQLNKPIVGVTATHDGGGYWLVASDGGVFNYGDAGFDGSAGSVRLNKPIVGITATPDGGGYWLVASDGGIFNYGDAGFDGSAGGTPLNAPIVGASGG
jgi:hypothetical protein